MVPQLTGRPARTKRTEPKPLAHRSEEEDSSTQYPPPGGRFSGADAWPVLKRRMTTTLKEKLVKIGAKVTRHAKYVTFQLAEVAVPRQLFASILERIGRLKNSPALCPSD